MGTGGGLEWSVATKNINCKIIKFYQKVLVEQPITIVGQVQDCNLTLMCKRQEVEIQFILFLLPTASETPKEEKPIHQLL